MLIFEMISFPFLRNSSVCHQYSAKSSLDNNYSIEEEVGSMQSGISREDQLSVDDDQTGSLLARDGLYGQSVDYTPTKQFYR